MACAFRASNCTFKLRVNELRASDNEVYRPAGHDRRRRATNEASRPPEALRRRSKVHAAASLWGDDSHESSVEAVCTNGRPANYRCDDLRRIGVVLTADATTMHGTLSRADQGRCGYNEYDHRVDRADEEIALKDLEVRARGACTKRELIGSEFQSIAK